VEGSPCARETTWSSSQRLVEPQMPPEWSGHWHRPPSRFQTSRRTWAGTVPGFDGRSFFCGLVTCAILFASLARTRSSPASRISSAEAPGWEWESEARAFSIFSRNRFGTVTWSRRRSAVSGSATARSFGAGGAGACDIMAGGGRAELAWGSSASRTGLASAEEGMAASSTCATGAGARTTVTTSRRGGASSGRISAATSAASRFERWKNRGRTSSKFSGVATFESSKTVVRHRRPSRRGSTTEGRRWTSSAAALR